MLAKEAREITIENIQKEHKEYICKHEKYAKKISDTKVKRKAKRGYTCCIVKIRKGYNINLIAKEIKKLGYNAIIIKKKYIKVIW